MNVKSTHFHNYINNIFCAHKNDQVLNIFICDVMTLNKQHGLKNKYIKE